MCLNVPLSLDDPDVDLRDFFSSNGGSAVRFVTEEDRCVFSILEICEH